MASPRTESKRVILVKEESTPGVDSVPTSVNCVRLESLTVKPLEVKEVERNYIRSFSGSSGSVAASFMASLEMEIALAIGGNSNGIPMPGTTPQWDALFRGCATAKLTSASPILGTAQGGTRNSIKLASGASATDDAYFGLSIDVTMQSGTAQAPGSAAKNILKLAATDKFHGGTLQAGSTDTLLNFAATASAEDGEYVGMTVVVGAESSVISDYVGATQVATLATPLASAPGAVAYTVQKVDDYYKDMTVLVEHFAGTVRDTAQYPSNKNYLHLPGAVVGTNNLLGCYVEVTTGANPVEIKRCVKYDTVTKKLTMDKALDVEPTSTSTFRIIEFRKIGASDGTTKILTLLGALKFVTTSSTPYQITDKRLIISYDGTTKIATVSTPFVKAPNADTTYIFRPYIKYYPISSGIISNTIYYYDDGALHTFTYGRGTATLDFTSGAIPMCKLSYQGLVERYEDGAFPDFDDSAWVDPLPVNYANTAGLIIANYSDAVMDKITIDLGVELVHIDQPGAELIHVKDHKAKGNISIWKPLPSEFDYQAEVRAGDLNTLAFTHGPVGNQIAFVSKNAQIKNPAESGKDGISMIGLDLVFVATAEGNDWALILQ